MENLSPASKEKLLSLQADPKFITLLDEISQKWAPQVPVWTPSGNQTLTDWVSESTRHTAYNTLISLLRGNSK